MLFRSDRRGGDGGGDHRDLHNTGHSFPTRRSSDLTAAFDRTGESPAVFTVAYVVRAVSPGRYVLPQAMVEDMYRPDRFGRTATGAIEITAAR